MNGDCELYLCFHFHPETTRNENRLLDKRKREFNLKAFARMIHKFFEYLDKIKNLFH